MSLFTSDDPRINRNGRPRKGKTLTDLLEKAGKDKGEDGQTNKSRLAQELWIMAMTRTKDQTQLAAIKYIFDRIDGKPIETIRQQFEEGALSPIVILPKKDMQKIDEAESRNNLETPAETSPGA
jgi:hypothetical protein